MQGNDRHARKSKRPGIFGVSWRFQGNLGKADPFNIEIRLIRLSVQLNAPGFLAYNSNIEEDKKFIAANRGTITSEALKVIVDDIIE